MSKQEDGSGADDGCDGSLPKREIQRMRGSPRGQATYCIDNVAPVDRKP